MERQCGLHLHLIICIKRHLILVSLEIVQYVVNFILKYTFSKTRWLNLHFNDGLRGMKWKQFRWEINFQIKRWKTKFFHFPSPLTTCEEETTPIVFNDLHSFLNHIHSFQHHLLQYNQNCPIIYDLAWSTLLLVSLWHKIEGK